MVLCWKRMDWSLYLEAAGWSVDQCSYTGLLWWKQPQGIAVDFLGSNCSDPPLWPQAVTSEQNKSAENELLLKDVWVCSKKGVQEGEDPDGVLGHNWEIFTHWWFGSFLISETHIRTHTQEAEEVVGFCLDCCPHSPGLENSWVVPIMSHIVQKSTVVAFASLILCFVFLYYCSSLAVLAYACKCFKPFKKLRISVGADQNEAFQMRLSTWIILIF